MIKLIAFDLIGVLAFEKDIELSEIEDKIERKFGQNRSDEEFINEIKDILTIEESEIINLSKNIISKLYYLKDKDLLKKIKEKYPNIKICIATNHVSFIKEFIDSNFDLNYLDDVIISANIGKIKPNIDFYEEIKKRFNISGLETLFVDDNQENIDGAIESGLNVLKINKGDIVFDKIIEYLENKN